MMAPNLFDVMIKKAQRETAGSDTSARYSYQHRYAILELLRRHEMPGSYAIAFEFHDDIVFFNDEAQPTHVEFAQVKTTSSAKSKGLNTLYSRRQGKNSVLGKLALHIEGLPSGTTASLYVVCNKEFSFSDTNIKFQNLPEKTREKIRVKLNEEFDDFDENILEMFEFHVTNVAIEHQHTYLKGKAIEFFEGKVPQDKLSVSQLFLLSLGGEVRRRNDSVVKDFADVSSLLNEKALTRTEVQSMLDLCLQSTIEPPSYIKYAFENAKDCGWSIKRCYAFSVAVMNVYALKLEPLDKSLAQIVEVSQSDLLLVDGDLADVIEKLGYIIQSHSHSDTRFKDELMAKALGYVQYFEGLSTEAFSPASTVARR